MVLDHLFLNTPGHLSCFIVIMCLLDWFLWGQKPYLLLIFISSKPGALELLKSSQVLVAQLCPILCNPMGCVACQAPLSMGLSRQEYWSGLPFPSPEYVGNYWRWVLYRWRFIILFLLPVQLSSVTQLCPTLCNYMDCVACQAPLSMWFSRQEY